MVRRTGEVPPIHEGWKRPKQQHHTVGQKKKQQEVATAPAPSVGGYETPARERSTALLRWLFIGAIGRHAPEVLHDLGYPPSTAVGPALSSLDHEGSDDVDASTSFVPALVAAVRRFSEDGHFDDDGGSPYSWEVIRSLAAIGHPDATAYVAQLHAWGNRWHLTDAWCLECATELLHLWPHGLTIKLQRSAEDEEIDWTFALSFHEPDDPTDVRGGWFQFAHPGWHPGRMSRTEASRLIEKAFKEHLKSYLDEIDREASVRGLTETIHRRKEVHFRWLVLHHVLGLTYEQIIEQDTAQVPAPDGGTQESFEQGAYEAAAGRSPSTISEALAGLYELLGLSRRPDLRSRSRGLQPPVPSRREPN